MAEGEVKMLKINWQPKTLEVEWHIVTLYFNFRPALWLSATKPQMNMLKTMSNDEPGCSQIKPHELTVGRNPGCLFLLLYGNNTASFPGWFLRKCMSGI